MKKPDRRNAIKAMAGTAGLAALSGTTAAATQDRKGADLKIPASLKAEHDEIHEELVAATKAGGKTGDAAKAVARILHPHFTREEELAMPPLGLLRALADGKVTPDMARVLELTDKLKKELPGMLKEHEAVVAALKTLSEAAREENKPKAGHLADKLKQHARTEEEVLYPAALLVGEYVRLKLGK